MTLQQHYDSFTDADLKALINVHHQPSVSLFMPTHRQWSEQDSIRLKNLRQQAEATLESDGHSPHEIQALFEPIEPWMDRTHTFWDYQESGLAVFLADGIFHYYRVPIELTERAVVNDRFYVKPLVPMLSYDNVFALLALDLGDVKLYQGTRSSLAPVALEDVPHSLQEALKFDQFEKSIQGRSGAGRTDGAGRHGTIYHGHGDAGDEAVHKEQILDFFKHLDNGVRDWLVNHQMPLVIAGVEYVTAIYKKANRYSRLVDDVLDLNPNPKSISTDELHSRALKVVEPIFSESRDEAIARFKQLRGQSKPLATEDVNVIVPASHYQQIDTLFVRKGDEKWGLFAESDNSVLIHETRQKGDLCLLDYAVAHTLMNKGQVFLLDDEHMPTNLSAAAILRSEWTA